MSESFSETMAVIIASGIFGRAIDFVLGKTGQARVKLYLENWWYRFSDVKLNNFGRKEAQFATDTIDFLFGRTFSNRRLGWFVVANGPFISLLFANGQLRSFNTLPIDQQVYMSTQLYRSIVASVLFCLSI